MLWVNIDKKLEIPVTRQVYQQIRKGILSGQFQRGEKLPSTRELALNLQVSRNVILEAYEQLISEGFIEGMHGSGTYVAEGAYLENVCVPEKTGAKGQCSYDKEKRECIDFRSGVPALDLFPRKRWARLLYDVCLESPSLALGYGDPGGNFSFRRTISRYLSKTRGVICEPERIIITTGAVQALSLTARLLLAPGDMAVIENPSNLDLQDILMSTGASLHPVPVDENGLITTQLPHDIRIKMVYITPSHQFPLGGILPIQRRIELIQFARKTDCYIVEDDYDSEFRYEGSPVSSLQGLEPERTIYIGTFSKTLFPALRIGYMVLPHSLVEECRNFKRHADFQTPLLDQLALSRFIEDGLLDLHIGRMKKVYRKRREKLVSTLNFHFPDMFYVKGKASGLHLVAGFKEIEFHSKLLERLEDAGVRVHPVEEHSICKGLHQNEIILGYGNVTEAQIEEGIKRMKSVLGAKNFTGPGDGNI